jgi:hypothetical protein
MTDAEIVLAGGERVRVAGDAKQAETAIVSAARGSILELAWLTEADTARPVGINPDHVLMIRALDEDPTAPSDTSSVASTAASGGDPGDQDRNGAPVTPDR